MSASLTLRSFLRSCSSVTKVSRVHLSPVDSSTYLLRARRRLDERFLGEHTEIPDVLVALVFALEKDLTLVEVALDVLLLLGDVALVVGLLRVLLLALLLELDDVGLELFGFGVDLCSVCSEVREERVSTQLKIIARRGRREDEPSSLVERSWISVLSWLSSALRASTSSSSVVKRGSDVPSDSILPRSSSRRRRRFSPSSISMRFFWDSSCHGKREAGGQLARKGEKEVPRPTCAASLANSTKLFLVLSTSTFNSPTNCTSSSVKA